MRRAAVSVVINRDNRAADYEMDKLSVHIAILRYEEAENRLTDRLYKESHWRDLSAPHIPMTGDNIVDTHITWVSDRLVTKSFGP
jgi:hypothetical protein